jgi:hypothetical protein
MSPQTISGVTVSGTPSIGQVLTATSSTTADWETKTSNVIDGVTVSGVPAFGQAILANSNTTASWQDITTIAGTFINGSAYTSPVDNVILTATASGNASWLPLAYDNANAARVTDSIGTSVEYRLEKNINIGSNPGDVHIHDGYNLWVIGIVSGNLYITCINKITGNIDSSRTGIYDADATYSVVAASSYGYLVTQKYACGVYGNGLNGEKFYIYIGYKQTSTNLPVLAVFDPTTNVLTKTTLSVSTGQTRALFFDGKYLWAAYQLDSANGVIAKIDAFGNPGGLTVTSAVAIPDTWAPSIFIKTNVGIIFITLGPSPNYYSNVYIFDNIGATCTLVQNAFAQYNTVAYDGNYIYTVHANNVTNKNGVSASFGIQSLNKYFTSVLASANKLVFDGRYIWLLNRGYDGKNYLYATDPLLYTSNSTNCIVAWGIQASGNTTYVYDMTYDNDSIWTSGQSYVVQMSKRKYVNTYGINNAGPLVERVRLSQPPLTVSTNVNENENIILVSPSGGYDASNVVVNLPANAVVGQEFTIKDAAGTAATHNLIITPPDGHTIDGASTQSIATNYGRMKVIYNGSSSWFIIG